MSEDIRNKPVYEFLGYRLERVNYLRRTDDELESFGILVQNSSLKDGVYVMKLLINLKFENLDEKSEFEFSSGFLINDEKWFENVEENIDPLFLSVLFPYAREKVHSITSDFRKSIDLPTLDLRVFNFDKEVIFTKQKK